MLNSICQFWLKEFKDNKKCNCEKIIPINSDEIEQLKLFDCKIDNNFIGVDYHCFPSIVFELMNIYGCSEKEIKSAIWECSSGINYRKQHEICKKDNNIWEMIKLNLYY